MLYKTFLLKDQGYPSLLREIPNPPETLYVKGKIPSSMPGIAIVGTREATWQGKRLAQAFAGELGRAGFFIVSGLALGIGSAVHRGALLAKAPTVAVLGSSIDRVYPGINEGLANRILKQGGAVVSEHAPGDYIGRESFILQNRIISGLSLGVLVIEAPQRSGALATARFAAEQGKEVFVLPGDIHNPNYVGSHELIRDGAILIHSIEDILEDLNLTRFQNSINFDHQ